MGGVVSSGANNDELIDKLKEAECINDPEIERVFRLVDRANYLTAETQKLAYNDTAWKSGNLHLSAPCIYARVLGDLKLENGMSFLNVGSGTGYLSTMAGLLIGSHGINHGIEIHNDVVHYARDRLTSFLNNCGAIDVTSFCEPQFVHGNVFCLCEDIMLYDRVYVGASCPKAQENYLKNFLKIGGILVLPRTEYLIKITRVTSEKWTTETLLPVSFSTLQGIDKTSASESINMPLVNASCLQDISRELIRTVLREKIESENKDLRNSFCHLVNKGKKSVDRFPYYSDGDTDEEADFDLITQQRPNTQFLALLNMAMNRNLINHQTDDDTSMVEDDESTEDEENVVPMVVEVVEDENIRELIVNSEQVRDTLGLEAVYNTEQSEVDRVRVSYTRDTLEERLDSERSNFQRLLNEHTIATQMNNDVSDDGRTISEPAVEEQVNQCVVSVEVNPEARAALELFDDVQRLESEIDDCLQTIHASAEPTEPVPRISIEHDCDTPKTSSDEQYSSSKREKFDSGICEDLVECCDDSSTNSSLSESSGENESAMWEDNSSTSVSERKKQCKKKRRNRFSKVKKSSSSSSGSSVQCPSKVYSELMKTRVQLLPLPNRLKLFINYDRPL